MSFLRHFSSGQKSLRADILRSLSTKYTATGDRHDQAIEHLRDLGMERLTRESQATELGQRIRDYLIEPFEHAMDI